MTPAAEPKLWTVLDTIRADLAAITAGSAYWYTPHRVRVTRGGEGLWFVLPHLDQSLGTWNPGDVSHDPATIYLIRRGVRTISRHSTGTTASGDRQQAQVPVQVFVAQRFAASAVTDTPSEQQIIERMLADVTRKLTFEDPGVGVAIDADDTLEADDEEMAEQFANWAIGVTRFTVTYDYFSSAP